MKSSLASRRENCVFEIPNSSKTVNSFTFQSTIQEGSTFLSVLFIALVTLEYQCDPKLIHDINRIAVNFANSGGGCFVDCFSV